ncbi:MAG: hypothetical protein GF350_01815 [Chitinivibrionales bacterium]|nr:hypothetical protein [Chitinivibrionales bacterium]
MPMDQDRNSNEMNARSSVDMMLRSMQMHHVHLSSMADQKASILIGAEAVVLTLIFRYLQEGQASIWLLALGVTILFSAASALLAVMPTYKKKTGARPNWLFFSSFAPLSTDEYFAKMNEIISTDTGVYEAIFNDVQQLGRVLYRKKYRFLGYSYRILLIGLIITFCIVAAEWVMKAGAV